MQNRAHENPLLLASDKSLAQACAYADFLKLHLRWWSISSYGYITSRMGISIGLAVEFARLDLLLRCSTQTLISAPATGI